jgi:hypothetical protein
MRSSSHPRSSRWTALLAYVAGWLVLGGLVAGAIIVALDDGDDGEPAATLPPLQQTELTRAAERARCRLRRGPQPRAAQPPVEGPRARPLPVGIFSRPQRDEGLVGAMRRGTIVIQYRADLVPDELERLQGLQRAVPRATILVPRTAMPYRVAVTGWRRLLGCPAVDASSIDAIRLFRGRYVGQGPDVAG